MGRNDNGAAYYNTTIARVYGLKFEPKNAPAQQQRISFSYVGSFGIPESSSPAEQLQIQQDLANSCREKHWFRPNQAYLVLVRGMSFTINF